jgi:uncharacterized protein (DUF924 family)
MTDRDDWIEDVLGFWFGELKPEAWFVRNEAVDAQIGERFGALYERMAVEPPPRAFEDSRAALAAVILFDQFPRNMFRGTARAFVSDDLALQIARNAVDKEFDAELDAAGRQFIYMPLMHSEIAADQELCVSLFRGLGNAEALRYAEEHRDIIARFGRFPHRNGVLGRENTEAETAFLSSHAGFGQ